jgi:hypothetical protein
MAEENWKALTSLFPAGWQQMAWQRGAVERLRRFPSPDLLLRMLTQVRHGMVETPPNPFRISSGNSRVYTTFAIELKTLG